MMQRSWSWASSITKRTLSRHAHLYFIWLACAHLNAHAKYVLSIHTWFFELISSILPFTHLLFHTIYYMQICD